MKANTSTRDQIAKEIYAQTRAMNRTLKKARALGIRIALKVEGARSADGLQWGIGVFKGRPGDMTNDFVVAQWAAHVQAVTVRPTS
jgi:hypothetical protein